RFVIPAPATSLIVVGCPAGVAAGGVIPASCPGSSPWRFRLSLRSRGGYDADPEAARARVVPRHGSGASSARREWKGTLDDVRHWLPLDPPRRPGDLPSGDRPRLLARVVRRRRPGCVSPT